MIRVIALVGQKSLGFYAFYKFVRQGDVVTLARRRDQSDGKTEGFGRDMDFRAQSAARPAKTLGISPPFSLRAPAAC